MRLAIQVSGTPVVATPPGWGLVSVLQNDGASMRLYTYGRCARTTDPAAGWTWVFDSARNAVGTISCYRDNTASTFCRVCSQTTTASPSGTSHSTGSLTSNVANQFLSVAYASPQQDTWTQDALATERSDNTTTSGTVDICLSTAEYALPSTGATGSLAATLDSAVAADACTQSCLITSMGMTQTAGTGGGIIVHDNTKSANGTSFNLAEMQLSYPADILVVGTQGTRICYEISNKNSQALALNIGQVASPQATTWKDSLVNLNTNASTVATSASNLSSWTIDWGTKVGSGDEAGGTDGVYLTSGATLTTLFRGNIKLYGCQIWGSGAITVANGAASLTGDVQGCTFGHPAGASSLTFGSATFPLANMYDNTIQYTATTANDIVLGMFATKCKKLRITGQTFRSFLGANTAAAFSPREIIFEGTPGTADIRWGGTSATGWYLVQPEWSGNATKFAIVTSGNPAIANATIEYRLFNVKVVNASGSAIENIPVKVTDTLGNVLVNTVTDSSGRVSFGSGQTLNAVPVMDHYAVTTVYTQRHRGPFLFEYNTGNSKNTDYQSLRGYSKWPGHEGITTSAGSFEDLNTVVHLQTAAGAATGWIEFEQP